MCAFISLSGLSAAVALQYLDVSFNHIQHIEGLELLSSLTFLDLRSNRLTCIPSLGILCFNKSLKQLLLQDNPLAAVKEFRRRVVNVLPGIHSLDGVEVRGKADGSSYGRKYEAGSGKEALSSPLKPLAPSIGDKPVASGRQNGTIPSKTLVFQGPHAVEMARIERSFVSRDPHNESSPSIAQRSTKSNTISHSESRFPGEKRLNDAWNHSVHLTGKEGRTKEKGMTRMDSARGRRSTSRVKSAPPAGITASSLPVKMWKCPAVNALLLLPPLPLAIIPPLAESRSARNSPVRGAASAKASPRAALSLSSSTYSTSQILPVPSFSSKGGLRRQSATLSAPSPTRLTSERREYISLMVDQRLAIDAEHEAFLERAGSPTRSPQNTLSSPITRSPASSPSPRRAAPASPAFDYDDNDGDDVPHSKMKSGGKIEDVSVLLRQLIQSKSHTLQLIKNRKYSCSSLLQAPSA